MATKLLAILLIFPLYLLFFTREAERKSRNAFVRRILEHVIVLKVIAVVLPVAVIFGLFFRGRQDMAMKLTAVFVLLPIYFLFRGSVKKKSRSVGIERILEYGTVLKVIALIVLSLAVTFGVYVVNDLHEDEPADMILVISIFVVPTLYLTCRTLFSKIRYDNRILYHRSPLGRFKQANWSDLESVGYSKWFKLNYLTFHTKGKIWYSDWMDGFDEFEEFHRQMRRAQKPGLSKKCKYEMRRMRKTNRSAPYPFVNTSG